MKNGKEMLLKIIIPNLLLSILFLLVFDVLNWKLEITNSLYIFFFAITFTFIDLVAISIKNSLMIYLVGRVARIYQGEKAKAKVILIIYLCNIFSFLLTIVIFFLVSLRYNDNIIFEYKLLPLLIGFIVVLLRFVLNLFLRNIIFSQPRIPKKQKKFINDIMSSEDMTNAKTDEERFEIINKALEELKRMESEDNSKED